MSALVDFASSLTQETEGNDRHAGCAEQAGMDLPRLGREAQMASWEGRMEESEQGKMTGDRR